MEPVDVEWVTFRAHSPATDSQPACPVSHSTDVPQELVTNAGSQAQMGLGLGWLYQELPFNKLPRYLADTLQCAKHAESSVHLATSEVYM